VGDRGEKSDKNFASGFFMPGLLFYESAPCLGDIKVDRKMEASVN
jgi:hypothetical protein